MLYMIELWVYGRGYFKAPAIGKKSALAKEVEMLSHFSWYDLRTYEVKITRVL